MKEIKKATKAAGYVSPAAAAAAGWKPGQDDAPAAIVATAPATTAKIIPFNRAPGAHAGRIETGTAQYWDDDADERDYR